MTRLIIALALVLVCPWLASGQYSRVLYNTDSFSLLPTNLLTSATLVRSAWAVKTLSAFSNATNYVVDVNMLLKVIFEPASR